MSQLDKELRARIEEPASEEAEREARLSPTEATAQMRINVPAQRNRKLRITFDGTESIVRARRPQHSLDAICRLRPS